MAYLIYLNIHHVMFPHLTLQLFSVLIVPKSFGQHVLFIFSTFLLHSEQASIANSSNKISDQFIKTRKRLRKQVPDWVFSQK